MVPFILVDGTVYQCCGLTEGNQRRLVAPHTLGNVFDKPFNEIWKSREYNELRKMINKNQVPDICHLYRECTMYDAGPPLKMRDDCEIRVKQRAAGSRNE
ncbi:MAG: SPASM domain-containing protein [Deltaproteobacteria bacterium]|nr:MAG: SPASM domain-containing protein [Deltaproteobacteria bacterium]